MSSIIHQTKGDFTSKAHSFEQQCATVVQSFKDSDDIVQAGRNTLKKIDLENTVCVVKAFFIPKLPQNYSYGLFSKSKAKKSYDNGNRLLKLGFNTPKPIGYFERRAKGKLLDSYYICEFAEETQTLYSLIHSDTTLNDSFIHQFTKFCYSLHSNGILHRDFNPKNILISDIGENTQFSLVDINRITWSKALSLEKSMGSLSRLPLKKERMDLLLESYAVKASVNMNLCQESLKAAQERTERYFRNKRRFRKIFPKR